MSTLPSALRRGASFVAALTLSATAWAQVPFADLRLVFTQPTGTALSTDSIPVYVTLTNTNASQAFVFDNNLPLAGLNPADVPTSTSVYDPVSGQWVSVDFASYGDFRLSMGYGCSGTFTSVCDAGAYEFNFADSYFSDPYTLAPGASHTYLFGNFVPVGGNAPSGDYEFYRSVVWLDVNGLDAGGDAISAVVFPASTCSADSAAACAALGATIFTRTVVEVPEPGSALLLALGLGGLVLMRRRRG